MKKDIPKANYVGEIVLGDQVLSCAVLDDGTRLLSERSVTKALGGKRGGSHWVRKKANLNGANLPVYVSAKNLQSFIDEDLALALSNPVEYKDAKSGAVSFGLEATLLPRVCEVFLKARDAKKTYPSQAHIAIAADILIRGLAHVGIIALVDEATGYQDARARDALVKILEKYVSDEARPWVITFDNEFYKLLFKLNNWPYNESSSFRPGIVGKWTNDIYDRLAPGIREKLHEVVKRNVKGKPTEKLHQHITYEKYPELVAFLTAVKALMRASTNMKGFQRLLQRAYPKFNTPYELLFDDDEE